ncbi:MAG: hypothetical protein DRG24_07220 [Epsilonproteobacteria bacterium]|nr:MAG: hypothetical protein DRG24_07220 [Campylobacterota bacterium]
MRIQMYINFLGILLSIVSIIFVMVENNPFAEEIQVEKHKIMGHDIFWNNTNITVQSVQKIGER